MQRTLARTGTRVYAEVTCHDVPSNSVTHSVPLGTAGACHGHLPAYGRFLATLQDRDLAEVEVTASNPVGVQETRLCVEPLKRGRDWNNRPDSSVPLRRWTTPFSSSRFVLLRGARGRRGVSVITPRSARLGVRRLPVGEVCTLRRRGL